MNDKKDILWLDPGHAFGLRNRTSPFIEDNFIQIDQYDFAQTELETFKCVVVHYLHRRKLSRIMTTMSP